MPVTLANVKRHRQGISEIGSGDRPEFSNKQADVLCEPIRQRHQCRRVVNARALPSARAPVPFGASGSLLVGPLASRP
jgi:hypothetical protein